MIKKSAEALKLPRFFELQLLIIGCGLAVLYSNTSLNMLLRHLVWLSVGLLVWLTLRYLSLESIWRFTPAIVLFSFLLNLLPHIPFFSLSNAGSARWIQVAGISLQVSEVLKLSLILFLSRACTQLKQVKSKWSQRALLTAVPLIAMLLVIFQKDYSTALLLLCTTAVLMSFFSWKMVLYSFFLAVLATLLAFFALGQNFRSQRFSDWLNGGSEQINWVHQALERGGLFGVGIGRGEKKFIIPAEMTDFPLSSVGEESGYLGLIFIAILFLIYTLRGFKLAQYSNNLYINSLCIGFTMIFALQGFINMMITAGLTPVTGQPLPFFSVGGSSVVLNMAGFGIINNIRARLRRSLHAQP